MAGVCNLDCSNEAFAYMDGKRGLIAGVPCLILRIGFVGELGYEIHFPSPFGEYFLDTLLEKGADLGIRPFGLEPQRILRLEKMHIIVSQDTDSESNLLEANMPWIVKADKDDFVGKWSLEKVQERAERLKLVGFEMNGTIVPPDGAQVVIDGKPGGRVTSSRWSPTLGKAVGMGWVPPELADDGSQIQIRVAGHLATASVRLRPFYDPDGEKLKA
jgi:sarcosine oxidase subunit alpha